MSNASLLPLRIELRHSRLLAVLLGLLAVLGALALSLSRLPPPAWVVGVLAIVASVRQFRRMPVGELLLRADGSAALREPGAAEDTGIEQLRLQRRGPVWVVALQFAGDWRRICLLPDVLPAAQARALWLWDRRRQSGEVAHVPAH